jgi:hypothetical protein
MKQLVFVKKTRHFCKVCTDILWSPLWSSDLSSWLWIQMSGFDPRRCQIFWEAVGLERGQLSLVNTTEELLERKSSGSSLEIREYSRGNPSRWRRCTLYPQTLALTSPTSGGRSVGIVRSRTQATEFSLCTEILADHSGRALSKARNLFACSNTEIVGSGHGTSWSPVQGVLPTVY